MMSRPAKPHPALDWRAAQAVGDELIAEQRGEATASASDRPLALLFRTVSASIRIGARRSRARAMKAAPWSIFDADTGALLSLSRCRPASTAATRSRLAHSAAYGARLRPAVPHLRLRARPRHHHAVGDRRLHLVEEAGRRGASARRWRVSARAPLEPMTTE